jgi:hypothetical protein
MSSIGDRQLALCPLPTFQIPCKHTQIIPPRLIEHIQTRTTRLVLHSRDTHVRSLQAWYGTPSASHSKHVCLDILCLLSRPVDIVSHDRTIRHLSVEVLGEPKRAARVDVGYGIAGRVLPLVDGMLIGSLPTAVGVAPPDGRCVVYVDHHGIGCSARLPTVAANTGMDVHVLPSVLFKPLVLALVPAVLLESRLIGWVPEVHAGSVVVERDGAVVAVAGRELGSVGVAVVVAVPACLESNVWGIVCGQIEIVQRSVLPDVGAIAVYLLLHTAVFRDVEDMPLSVESVSLSE